MSTIPLTPEVRRAAEETQERRAIARAIDRARRSARSSDTLTLRRIAIERRRQAQRLLAARAGRGR